MVVVAVVVVAALQPQRDDGGVHQMSDVLCATQIQELGSPFRGHLKERG